MFITMIKLLGFIFIISQQYTSGLYHCDRTLIGHEGVISSDNFPLDYANDLECIYTHYFKDVGEEPEEICFRFLRFDLDCPDDNLTLHNLTFCGTGDKSLAKLCFPVFLEEPFVIRFLTNSSIAKSGFYAEYKVKVPQPLITTTEAFVNTTETTTEGTTTTPAPDPEFCAEPDLWPCFSGKKCIELELMCSSSAVSHCADRSEKTYAHARCPGRDGQLVLSSRTVRACDFSFGQAQNASNGIDLSDCRIEVVADSYGKDSWVLDAKSNDEEYGPKSVRNYKYDETFGQWNRYVRTNFSAPLRYNAQFRLETYGGQYGSGQPYCLTFWYHMFGKDAGRLDVFWGAGEGAFSKPAWTREGNLGDRWYKAEIQRVPSIDDFFFQHIWFNVHVGGERRAQVAIGDISLMPIACHSNSDYDIADDISCTFEVGSCQWSIPSQWSISNAVYENGDRGPPGASQGLNYLHPFDDSPLNFTSPVVTSIIEDRCLILDAYSTVLGNEVTVTIELEDDDFVNLDDQPLTLQHEWERFMFNVSSLKPFRITIASTLGRMYFDNIATVDNLCNNLDYGTCKYWEYRCESLVCIDASRICNGIEDCPTGDDERDCVESGGGLPQGVAIFLVVLICVVVVAALIGGIVFWRKRKPKKSANREETHGLENNRFHTNTDSQMPENDFQHENDGYQNHYHDSKDDGYQNYYYNSDG